jgi:hypothetical protein
MYFNVGKGITKLSFMMIFVLLCLPTMAKQKTKKNEVAPSSFTAQPDQCVTLRQGRDCFASIELHWKAPSKQAVCLFQEGKQRKIKCWNNHDHGDMVIEFESSESINYQLRTVEENKLLLQTHITVSWLHKSSARKRRWRLF